MKTVLKTAESGFEVSPTYEIVKINKSMWKTVHSKYI